MHQVRHQRRSGKLAPGQRRHRDHPTTVGGGDSLGRELVDLHVDRTDLATLPTPDDHPRGGVSRIGGQAGTQAPGPARPSRQDQGSRAGSTTHTLPAESGPGFWPVPSAPTMPRTWWTRAPAQGRTCPGKRGCRGARAGPAATTSPDCRPPSRVIHHSLARWQVIWGRTGWPARSYCHCSVLVRHIQWPGRVRTRNRRSLRDGKP